MNWKAQLSANNRQELSRMRSELAQKQSQQLDAYLQALRNQLNSQRQREAERALESTELPKTVLTCPTASSPSLRLTASFLPR